MKEKQGKNASKFGINKCQQDFYFVSIYTSENGRLKNQSLCEMQRGLLQPCDLRHERSSGQLWLGTAPRVIRCISIAAIGLIALQQPL